MLTSLDGPAGDAPAEGEPPNLASLGELARAVVEAVERHRAEPASLGTLLVDLYRRLGFLPDEVLAFVSHKTRVPLASLHALVSLSSHLSRRPPPAHWLGVCTSAPCAARGAGEVERILRERGIPFSELPCQGACDLGPIACYNGGPPLPVSPARARSLAKAAPSDWEDVLSVEKPVHAFKTGTMVAFANIFAKGSHLLATAKRHGVYAPVEKALNRSADEVLDAVTESGLLGATETPVAERWRAVRRADGARVVVVDATDGAPGSFKDRILLERDPHLVIAGTILASHAVGAVEAYLLIRAEYELAGERCRAAVDEAQRAGLLGRGLGDSPVVIRIRVRTGASSTGDAAALVAALEGRPPSRDPRRAVPEESGLFDRPTLIETADTLAQVPALCERGPAWFKGLGCQGAVGLKIFSLSGDVRRPGNYELPRGTPLRHLVEELGGGPLSGKEVAAVMIGGRGGGLLPPSALALPLIEGVLQAHGVGLGSGAIVVASDKTCLLDLARREVAFVARETSGACELCRKGAFELVSAMQTLSSDRAASGARSSELDRELPCAPCCSQGLFALSVAKGLVGRFPEAVTSHRDGSCACHPRRSGRT